MFIDPIKKYIEQNLVDIVKDARLRGRMIKWGGRFQVGQRVPVGTAVMYIDRVFLCMESDHSDMPHEGGKGWGLLVNLAYMRLNEFPWVSMKDPATGNKTVHEIVLSRMLIYALNKIRLDVLRQPVDGLHQWRGIFQWGENYSDGDIVAYDKAIYMATPGNGVPSVSQGWSVLDAMFSKGGWENYLAPPEGLRSAQVLEGAESVVVLTFSGTVSTPTSAPECGWSVEVEGAGATISSAIESGSTIELTLAADIECGNTFRVSYDDTSCDLAVDGETLDSVTNFNGQNQILAPVFTGMVSDSVIVEDVAIPGFDMSVHFSGGVPDSYVLLNAPLGLTIDNTGWLSGTVADPGVYTGVQVQGIRGECSSISNEFTVTVTDVLDPPLFDGAMPDFTGLCEGIPMVIYDASVHFTTGGPVNGYTLQNAPAWMSVDSMGVISGTPDGATNATGVTVTAQNGVGSDTSDTFDVTAAPLPNITVQPQGQTVTRPSTATFSVTALLATSYQWYRDGALIAGATADSYTTPPTSTDESGDGFFCAVSNACGTVNSAFASLVVNANPPVFDGTIPNLSSVVGTPMAPYDASDNFDTGGEVDTYTIQNAPAWMSIDPTTGIITGTSDTEAVTSGITVTATNVDGSAVSNTFQMDSQITIPEAVRELLALAPDSDGVMQMIVEGVGPGSYTHASRSMVRQANGIYAYAEVDEPMWNHGRVVRALNVDSEDLTTWTGASGGMDVTTGVADPNGGNNAFTLTYNTHNRLYVQCAPGQNLGARGHRLVTSMWLRRRSGTGVIRLCAGRLNGVEDVKPSVTAEWQPIATTLDDVADGSSQYLNITLGNVGDEVDVYHPMLEDVTGNGDASPGEYIPTFGTSGYTKEVRSYPNGNSVTDNVVTEAKGAPYSTVPRLLRHQDATNLVPYSDDFEIATTNWEDIRGALGATQDQIALDGSATGWSLIDNDAVVAQGARNTALWTPGAGVARVWIAEDLAATHTAEIVLLDNTVEWLHVYLAQSTGEFAVAPADAAYTTEQLVIKDGNNWVLMFDCNRIDIDRIALYPAGGSAIPPDGTDDPTVTGSTGFIQVEYHAGKTIDQVKALPPVITGATAETAFGGDADIPRENFNIVDFSDAALYFEHYTEAQQAGTDNNNRQGLSLHSGNRAFLCVQNESLNFALQGAPSRIHASTCSPGTLNKVALMYDNALPNNSLNANDNQSGDQATAITSVNDSGGPLRTANTDIWPYELGNLQRYGQGGYQQYKEVIDTLMAPVANLAFHAIAPDPVTGLMQGVLEGVGDITHLHASANYVRTWIPGRYGLIPIDQPMYTRGRVVRNLLSDSHDITAAAWGLPSGLTEDDFETVTLTGTGAYVSNLVTLPDGGTTEGRHFVCSFELNANGNTTSAIKFSLRAQTGGTTEALIVTLTAVASGTGWVRYALLTSQFVNPDNTQLRVRIFPNDTASSGTYKIRNFQLEDMVSVPGAYVENIGAGVAVDVSGYQNGNTIDADGIVTEALGAPYSTVPRLLRHQDATNWLTNNRALDVWAGTGGLITYDQVGVDGAPNTAATIAKNNTGIRNDISVASGDSVQVALWVLKTVGDSATVNIDIQFANQSTQRYQVSVDSTSGIASVVEQSGAVADNLVVDDGIWWKLIISATDEWASASARVWLRVPVASVLEGVIDVPQGYWNSSIDAVKALPPIITGASELTAFGGVPEWDKANVSDTSAAWFFELNYADGGPFAAQYFNALDIVSVASSGNLQFGGTSQRYQYRYRDSLSANKSLTSGSNTLLAGVDNKLAYIYDQADAKANANGNNTWLVERTDFDHLRNDDNNMVLRQGGTGMDVPVEIGNIQRYESNWQAYEAYKLKIDELMGT